MAQFARDQYLVAVVGAGPAGLFAAQELAQAGVRVILFNRDIKPGGLAEYGIYPTKWKMKEGLRRQFQLILEEPLIEYYGNVKIGQQGDLSLPDLRSLGFQAILVAVGAQGTKWLGLPGEDLPGVYHAKDLVYHYNKLPPYSERKYPLGARVALIGAGNVMVDIARWAIREQKVDEVVAVVRRGPAEVKFTKKELEGVVRNLDLGAYEQELKRVAPVMAAVGQDAEAARSFVLSALPKAEEPVSRTRFRFEFLASPLRMISCEEGVVCGLEIEDTTLIPGEGEPQAKRLGSKRLLDADTVVFCIGDRVDESFGLPVRKDEFVKNPSPRYPVEGLSYEAYHPDLSRPIERVFVAGWARAASKGLVGMARKDGENGARAVLQHLETLPPLKNQVRLLEHLQQHLVATEQTVVVKDSLAKLAEAEQAEARSRGLEEYKFNTNAEMLGAMGLVW